MFEHVWLEIKESAIKPGSLGIWWLGQSGYALKNSSGEILYIDPYLTDTISAGYRPYIHARLIPPVVEPDADLDILGVLLTHDHQDHMDPNTVVILAEKENIRLAGSPEVCQKMNDILDIPKSKVMEMQPGKTTILGSFEVIPVKAVHSGGALGYVLRIEGLTLYFSGDTVLFYSMREIGSSHPLDAAFLCFNGQAGNMDIRAALHAIRLLGVKTVIPSHYGMYADNTAEPERLEYQIKKHLPGVSCRILQPGRVTILDRRDKNQLKTDLR